MSDDEKLVAVCMRERERERERESSHCPLYKRCVVNNSANYHNTNSIPRCAQPITASLWPFTPKAMQENETLRFSMVSLPQH